MSTQRPLQGSHAGTTPNEARCQAEKLEKLTRFLAGFVLSDDALIETERSHACTELARHWFGCVLHAWKLWGQRDGKLLLNRCFLPSNPVVSPGAYALWHEFYEVSKKGLAASVALNEGDLRAATKRFIQNIAREFLGTNASIELPHQLVLTRQNAMWLVTAV